MAVAEHNPAHTQIHNYQDIYPHLLAEIEHFFSVYKQLEGKRTQVTGWRDAAHAQKVILQSHERIQKSGLV